MKNILAKRNFTRITALLLVVAVIFGTMFSLPVSAASGDKVTITFDYCYDSTGNTIKFQQTTVSDGYTLGTVGEELCKIFADGKEAYCIEPGHTLYSGNTLTESASTVWKNLGSAKQKAINLALLYGKPGSEKSLSGTEDQKWVATQLIVYGILLMYIMLNGNNGQPLSGLDKSFKNFVTGSFLKIRGVPIPNYVWYACVVVVFMWFMWNKTTFGKNMFAVGSNPEAANVSGVNVMRTTILVHTLAGCMYGITGFIESARIGSNQANTGLNYECDAIAACVIGGVSFVGGTGKISGVVLGVFILRIIFVALQFLAVSQNMQYVIKGLIILIACAIDMRKYLVRK